MSELTLLLLRIGFLVLMWFFVFAVVYSLRADLFGVRVRKLPEAQAAGGARGERSGRGTGEAQGRAEEQARGTGDHSTVSKARDHVRPEGGARGPARRRADVDRPLQRVRSRDPRRLHLQPPRPLLLWGDQWMIQDLDSTNGTFLGGERVGAPVAVAIGAPIKVGATTFELRA